MPAVVGIFINAKPYPRPLSLQRSGIKLDPFGPFGGNRKVNLFWTIKTSPGAGSPTGSRQIGPT
ncbi:MAG: hypothetical protein ACUVSP_04940 [Desulfotomaculales bacterium]